MPTPRIRSKMIEAHVTGPPLVGQEWTRAMSCHAVQQSRCAPTLAALQSKQLVNWGLRYLRSTCSLQRSGHSEQAALVISRGTSWTKPSRKGFSSNQIINERTQQNVAVVLHDLSYASTWAENELDGSDHDMVEISRDTGHREYLCRLRQDVCCRVSPRNVGQKEPFHAARGRKGGGF
jgi:hypothetical protein